MASKVVFSAVLLVLVLFLNRQIDAKGIAAPEESDLSSVIHDAELAELDDGNVETALLNYLFAKQIMSRLRNNADARDLLKKRTYWKQCAFNAVSCFGK